VDDELRTVIYTSVKKLREEIILVFLFVIAPKKPVRRRGKEKKSSAGSMVMEIIFENHPS